MEAGPLAVRRDYGPNHTGKYSTRMGAASAFLAYFPSSIGAPNPHNRNVNTTVTTKL